MKEASNKNSPAGFHAEVPRLRTHFCGPQRAESVTPTSEWNRFLRTKYSIIVFSFLYDDNMYPRKGLTQVSKHVQTMWAVEFCNAVVIQSVVDTRPFFCTHERNGRTFVTNQVQWTNIATPWLFLVPICTNAKREIPPQGIAMYCYNSPDKRRSSSLSLCHSTIRRCPGATKTRHCHRGFVFGVETRHLFTCDLGDRKPNKAYQSLYGNPPIVAIVQQGRFGSYIIRSTHLARTGNHLILKFHVKLHFGFCSYGIDSRTRSDKNKGWVRKHFDHHLNLALCTWLDRAPSILLHPTQQPPTVQSRLRGACRCDPGTPVAATINEFPWCPSFPTVLWPKIHLRYRTWTYIYIYIYIY